MLGIQAPSAYKLREETKFSEVRQAKFESFNTIARTMSIHYQNILNYFDNRSTNASDESFIAKIKGL
jgi:transposase